MAEIVIVKCMDIYNNKILMALQSGHIVEVEIENAKKYENNRYNTS